MKIEFKNDSIIETLDNEFESTRSTRGQQQLESAWNWIDDYYNKLSWHRKIPTKIKWLYDDFIVTVICLYYKIRKGNKDNL